MESSTALYIVPTPIGNLEDITLRAIRILKEVDFILSEDTRNTGRLLKHLEIDKPQQSYHAHNEHKVVNSLMGKFQNGQTAALVSDAGTPGISDPGFLLIRELVKAGVKVETLPGATAFVPALVNSGLPCDRFVFEGFLPHKKGRQKRIEELSTEPYTIVLYESPYRLLKMLTQLVPFFGEDREIAVVRELTKIYEETVRGTLAEVKERFEKQDSIKGEFVIVVKGKAD